VFRAVADDEILLFVSRMCGRLIHAHLNTLRPPSTAEVLMSSRAQTIHVMMTANTCEFFVVSAPSRSAFAQRAQSGITGIFGSYVQNIAPRRQREHDSNIHPAVPSSRHARAYQMMYSTIRSD
jgi:hypothetical protein